MDLSTPIVVTGAGGFIGSYFIQYLLDSGVNAEQIFACDDLEHIKNRKCTKSWKEQISNQVSREELLESLDQIQPKLIFHFGACSRTDETDWSYLEKTNINYTKALWNWSAKNQTDLVYASSAATYGGGEHGFDDQMEEPQKLEPLNFYGKSKWIFDLWTEEEIQKQNTPRNYWGFKFFNVYGPGEEHKGSQASVILHASKQAKNEGEIRLFKSHNPDFNDGMQMRDFIYVKDLAKVMLWTVQHKPKSGIYNLGTGNAQSFIDLAEGVKKALNLNVPIKFIPTPEILREHYQYFTEAKMDKLREAGYSDPFSNLEAGIADMVGELG